MIESGHVTLSIRRQCELLGLSRASYYDTLAAASALNLELMRRIDEQYLETPFYGWPRMTAIVAKICNACPVRAACTRSKQGGRNITFRPRAQYEARQQTRAMQNDEAFKRRYRARLGIEGTLSQAVRAYELRRTRYLGLAKTYLQAIALAAAINLSRF